MTDQENIQNVAEETVEAVEMQQPPVGFEEQQAPQRPRFLQVELIPKMSTLEEIEELWKASGRRSDVRTTGSILFPRAANFSCDKGVVQIESEGRVYFYNNSDFYRVKVTPIF